MIFNIFGCKVSPGFRCSLELVIRNGEIAWLISLSSEKLTSSKKEYFIFGWNLKLQKQGNKTGNRSQIHLLQTSLLLIRFEAIFTSCDCNSTLFQEFQREIPVFIRIPSVNTAHPNDLLMLFLLFHLWHFFYEIMDCGRESLCDSDVLRTALICKTVICSNTEWKGRLFKSLFS